MIPALRRTSSGREDGTSLLEMMVVVGLLTVVIGATLTTLVSGMHMSDNSEARTSATQSLRFASDAMTQALRTAINLPTGINTAADGFYVAAPQQVIFYADLANQATTTASPTASASASASSLYEPCPERVEFTLDSTNNQLDEYTWAPTPSGLTCTYGSLSAPGTTRILASNLANPQGTIFTYYAQSDAPPTSSLPTGSQQQLGVNDTTSTSAPAAAQVGINLVASADAGGQNIGAPQISTLVSLVNASAASISSVVVQTQLTTPPPTTTTATTAPTTTAATTTATTAPTTTAATTTTTTTTTKATTSATTSKTTTATTTTTSKPPTTTTTTTKTTTTTTKPAPPDIFRGD